MREDVASRTPAPSRRSRRRSSVAPKTGGMSRRPSPLLVIVAVSALVGPAAPAIAAALDTTIKSGPSGLIASRTVTFRFTSNVSSVAFQCKLDASGWSPCASPKSYTKLSQGRHTFRVRANNGRAVDSTPAVRTFTVDTVKPQTTIQSGPSGETNDPTPSFTFSSSEPGTFQCKLLTSTFRKCSSPYVPASPLPDGTHTFKVRARDRAGNLDPTPASRSFSVERVLTADLAGARAAIAHYFPNKLVMDVPPICVATTSEVLIDCPGGSELPASDQLAIASSRTVVEVAPNQYHATITSDVASLRAVAVTWPAATMATECGLAMTSAHGDNPVWTVTVPLTIGPDPTSPESGENRARYSGLDVTGVEPHDWGITTWGEQYQPACGQGHFSSDFVAAIYESILDAHLSAVGNPLCAVTGPAHLGPCPEPASP